MKEEKNRKYCNPTVKTGVKSQNQENENAYQQGTRPRIILYLVRRIAIADEFVVQRIEKSSMNFLDG